MQQEISEQEINETINETFEYYYQQSLAILKELEAEIQAQKKGGF